MKAWKIIILTLVLILSATYVTTLHVKYKKHVTDAQERPPAREFLDMLSIDDATPERLMVSSLVSRAKYYKKLGQGN